MIYIISVKTKTVGVLHEFSTIPGVVEDVTDILLNIKSIPLKMEGGEPKTMTLKKEGPCEVKASDIQHDGSIEILDKDIYLASLDKDGKLDVELIVENNRGYISAEQNFDQELSVDYIPLDSSHSPIKKVNYVVEPTHLGRETSRERLVLDVWTDGTVMPVDAISNAAELLIEQFTPFFEYVKISQMKAEERAIRLSIPDEKYNMPVEQLDLSVRTMNCLRRSNITTVGELIAKGPKELLKLRNFGQKSYQEIEDKLAAIGLSLEPKSEETDEDEEQ